MKEAITPTPRAPGMRRKPLTSTHTFYRRERATRAHDGNQQKNTTTIPMFIAEITGNIASAFGLLGAALGVGLIGFKAAEAVGRNPGASGKVLVQAIIGMALAEGLGILALFLA